MIGVRGFNLLFLFYMLLMVVPAYKGNWLGVGIVLLPLVTFVFKRRYTRLATWFMLVTTGAAVLFVIYLLIRG